MDVPPIFRRNVCCVDADRFDGIDDLQNFLYLRPSDGGQQDLGAGPNIGDARAAPARTDGAQNVDA